MGIISFLADVELVSTHAMVVLRVFFFWDVFLDMAPNYNIMVPLDSFTVTSTLMCSHHVLGALTKEGRFTVFMKGAVSYEQELYGDITLFKN